MAGMAQYQRLPSGDADGAANHQPGEATIVAPSAPVVEVIDSDQQHDRIYDIEVRESPLHKEQGLAAAPPSYTSSSSIAPASDDAKLPSYEEYEKEHEHEDEFDTNLPEPYIMPADYATVRDGIPTVTVVEGYEFALGDDSTFVTTMMVSFFLSWLGFLLTYIFSRTIAGKCGATSGFGLGLIKIAFYIRTSGVSAQKGHQGDTHSGMSDDDQYLSWFVWLLILFGWFTFVRGLTMYFKYKRQFAIMLGDASTV